MADQLHTCPVDEPTLVRIVDMPQDCKAMLGALISLLSLLAVIAMAFFRNPCISISSITWRRNASPQTPVPARGSTLEAAITQLGEVMKDLEADLDYLETKQRVSLLEVEMREQDLKITEQDLTNKEQNLDTRGQNLEMLTKMKQRIMDLELKVSQIKSCNCNHATDSSSDEE